MMACMKNERSNLNVMINTLKYFGSCDDLELEESFQETCFGHVFSKTCQYSTRDEKVYKWLKYVDLNNISHMTSSKVLWIWRG